MEQVCKRCKYTWVSRVKTPKACPKCKSTLWNEDTSLPSKADRELNPDFQKECLRCGFEWTSRVENPKVCPNCKAVKWYRPRSKR